MAEVVLTRDNFDEVIKNATTPVLVDFWAAWCGPCRMVGPVVSQIAKEHDGKVVVGKVNVDEEEELSVQYGISSIPTLIVFKDGQVYKRTVGVQPKSELEALIFE